MQKLNKEELAKLVKMSKFDQVLYLLEKYDNYVPLQVYAAQIRLESSLKKKVGCITGVMVWLTQEEMLYQ